DVQSICRPKKSWVQVYGRTSGDTWRPHWVAVDTACVCWKSPSQEERTASIKKGAARVTPPLDNFQFPFSFQNPVALSTVWSFLFVFSVDVLFIYI
ncbi:hypothetical protein AVEN_104953-1, partial [Araneus ventricosus]